MATIYKETVTRPLPRGAEITTRKGEQVARWHDRQGKLRTARLTTGRDGSMRIVTEGATWIAKYRDGTEQVVKKSTGCRDESAARAKLNEFVRRSELVKANVITAAQDSVADHQDTPLAEHLTAYIEHQRAKALNDDRINSTQARIRRVAGECGFARLRDLNAAGLERWLTARQSEGMSAGNRNEFRQAMVGFANWCVRTHRLVANPFAGVPKADARADQRRKRRALTPEELGRLLKVARLRPLAEYGRETIPRDEADQRDNPRSRNGWAKVPLTLDSIDAAAARAREVLADKPGFIADLEQRGRERALIFKTLVLTGLRKGELASLTVGQTELDDEPAYLVLHAGDEKNRRGSEIPLRPDLAADLRQWLADRLAALRAEAHAAGDAIPARLPANEPLLRVPTSLRRSLDCDLKAAGIPKQDDRGRTVDVHAMRHTFGTLLSRGGVAPRTAQAAMRHGSIDLTMNTYTDPRLLDVAGALAALPQLDLDGDAGQRQKATGTADGPSEARMVVPTVGPTTGQSSRSGASADKSAGDLSLAGAIAGSPLSAVNRQNKAPADSSCQRVRNVEPSGIEPPTSALRTQRSPN